MACKLSMKIVFTTKAIADAASWYCAFVVVALIFLSSLKQSCSIAYDYNDGMIRSNRRQPPTCDEIYVVGEGETLHTISDKCGDPFIVEQNPHIHDPDDVFPGLVIKITPTNPIKLSN
ncbi:hypothetical protein LWI28_008548 [Acer negundo]|uniref:LysM domain-containing protein n=1 Tax=Acer negundo TaxID=4023 RepID=A0AAD5NUG3_ACENE|nr:hypothetical protein LWI28_008548 [Acer negundo]